MGPWDLGGLKEGVEKSLWLQVTILIILLALPFHTVGDASGGPLSDRHRLSLEFTVHHGGHILTGTGNWRLFS